MRAYMLTHLSDAVLVRDLITIVAQDRATTASLLAHLAEVDVRRLYVPVGYPSMHAYCVAELHFSDDSAFKRIRAARMARQFPTIFAAVADGRLHLSAVVMLAPYLTPETADELLAAAANKTKSEIEEQVLAQRFPRPDLPARLRALPASATLPSGSPAPGLIEQFTSGPVEQPVPGSLEQQVPGFVAQLAPGPVEARGLQPKIASRPKLTPLAPRRYALQVTIEQSTHDKLRYAQDLLGHRLPSGNVSEVLDLALDALIRRLEKTKFAAIGKPRSTDLQPTKPRPGPPPRPGSAACGQRYIPAHVKRVVWKRDQGQCTFVNANGHRCPARRFLEFDHVEPVARGGRATVEAMRLRCRAHNQYEAERAFGAEFMNVKRNGTRRVTVETLGLQC